MGLFSSLLNPFKSRKKLLDPLNLRRRALDPAGLLRDKNPPRKPTNPLMAKPGNRPGRMPRADFGAKPIGYSPRENIGKPQMMAKPISIAASEAGNQKPRGSTMPGVVNDTGYSQQLPPDVAQTHPQQGVVRDYVLNGARYVSNGARPQFRRSPEEREDISGIENPILAARRRRIPV